MRSSARILLALLIAVLVLPRAAVAAPKGNGKAKANLNITKDRSGRVVLSWTGKGMLKQARHLNERFKPIRKGSDGQNLYVVEMAESEMLYSVDSEPSGVFSINAVGYVNLSLPPGLSLLANPLLYTNNDVGFWFFDAPDGAQVFKYVNGGGFEVSTFDGLTGQWSNPLLQIPIGEGFYYSNPSTEIVHYTIVGEVMQGVLVNPLPAGASLKGSLVPQSGPLGFGHHLPGLPGDEVRTYTNDGQGGGTYNISLWDGTQWAPDLSINVAEGFWIQKQQPQNWIRTFFVNAQ